MYNIFQKKSNLEYSSHLKRQSERPTLKLNHQELDAGLAEGVKIWRYKKYFV